MGHADETITLRAELSPRANHVGATITKIDGKRSSGFREVEMEFDVDNFVLRAGLGLEAEDRLLLGSGLVRSQQGGLERLFNERYYQFIVWRAVSTRWNAKVEHDYHDLVIFDEHDQYAVVIEMKPWGSANGLRELPGIREDLSKLKKRESPVRCMMIFSANPRGQSSNNFKWLEEQIPELDSSRRRTFVFDTLNREGKEFEFWLALWLL